MGAMAHTGTTESTVLIRQRDILLKTVEQAAGFVTGQKTQ
jgi:hypothetical protein